MKKISITIPSELSAKEEIKLISERLTQKALSGNGKQLALKKFETSKDKIVNKAVFIQDDSYKADGCLDMDATWNTINK